MWRRKNSLKVKQLSLGLIAGVGGVFGFFGSARAVCSISSTSIVFGNYDPVSLAPLDTIGNIVYRCGNQDHDITISLDRGGAPSFSQRRLLKGTEPLFYNLYLDAARTLVWGDGSGGTQAYFIRNPQKNNQDIVVPIYGRIPGSQDVGMGSYGNTIVATLNY